MIFFTSDLHFDHADVIGLCNRPFSSVEEMNAELVKRWNKIIRPDDTIYVLGDLTLGKYSDIYPIVTSLNGNRYLIRGNHDKFTHSQYLRLGFKAIFQEVVFKQIGRTLRLSHYPYKPTGLHRIFAYKSELRFLDQRPLKRSNEILIHGHCHGKYKFRNRSIHVGVDAWNYRPVSLKEVESIVNREMK